MEVTKILLEVVAVFETNFRFWYIFDLGNRVSNFWEIDGVRC